MLNPDAIINEIKEIYVELLNSGVDDSFDAKDQLLDSLYAQLKQHENLAEKRDQLQELYELNNELGVLIKVQKQKLVNEKSVFEKQKRSSEYYSLSAGMNQSFFIDKKR